MGGLDREQRMDACPTGAKEERDCKEHGKEKNVVLSGIREGVLGI